MSFTSIDLKKIKLDIYYVITDQIKVKTNEIIVETYRLQKLYIHFLEIIFSQKRLDICFFSLHAFI